jgi:hypothetical protein
MSFVTAFFSNNAAGSMIAAAHAEGKISRKEMFVSAITNSSSAKLNHMLKPTIIIIPLLGLTAVIYLLLQFFLELIQILVVFYFGRSKNSSSADCGVREEKKIPSWKETFKTSFKATGKIILRVILITIPIYILVAYMTDKGVFYRLEKNIPSGVRGVLSPELIAIMGAKLGGLVSSATVAAKMLKDGTVANMQILIALMAANLFTIPFSAFRRNLPTAIGIFPKYDGILIVSMAQGLRFIFNIIALIVLIILQFAKA